MGNDREAMTLEQISSALHKWADCDYLWSDDAAKLADAIDAHLTRAAEPAAKLTLALDALAKIAAGTWNRRERHPQEFREYAASILRKINKERGNG